MPDHHLTEAGRPAAASAAEPEQPAPTASPGADREPHEATATARPVDPGHVSLLARIGRVFHRDVEAAPVAQASVGDATDTRPAGADSGDTAVATTGAAPSTAVPAGPPPIVEFRGVTKRFGTGEDTFTAIRDVTFSVQDRPGKGEFICILGPSGCGKSTILRLIAGLRPQYPATEGEVLIGGKAVNGPGADRGFVFQDYTSFPHRTVIANVAFGLECQGMSAKERLDLAREWIGKVGLDVARDANKYPHELSGGMRQRVAIARTLIMRPRIILMDEPFGALDPSTRLRMQDLLVHLWREAEATVFFITHSIEEAVYLGDRVYLMSPSPGTIVLQQEVPPPDFPAREMQRQPAFLEIVADLRDRIEVMEESTRAGT